LVKKSGVFFRQDKFEEALKCIEDAMALSLDHHALYYYKAEILRNMGNLRRL